MIRVIKQLAEVILFYSSYNLFHILKLYYINPLMGISNNLEFFNSIPTDTENFKNLIYYSLLFIISLTIRVYISK